MTPFRHQRPHKEFWIAGTPLRSIWPEPVMRNLPANGKNQPLFSFRSKASAERVFGNVDRKDELRKVVRATGLRSNA